MAEEVSINLTQRVGPSPGKLDDMHESDSFCKKHGELMIAVGNHDHSYHAALIIGGWSKQE